MYIGNMMEGVTDNYLQGIFLSEFDIDSGACFRSGYPASSSPNDVQDYLANHMLPDGAEKVEVASTVFMLHRQNVKAPRRYPVFAFRSPCSTADWEPFRPSGGLVCEMMCLEERDSTVTLQFHEEVLQGPWPASHMRLEFPDKSPSSVVSLISQLQDEARKELVAEGEDSDADEVEDYVFVEVQTPSVHLGIVLTSSHFDDLFREHQRLVERVDTPTSSTIKTRNSSLYMAGEPSSPSSPASPAEKGGQPLFVVTAVVSQRDSNARRGGITKAVAAVGPSLPWLQSIFPVLVHCARSCCDVKESAETSIASQTALLQSYYDALQELAKLMAGEVLERTKQQHLLFSVQKYCTTSVTYITPIPRSLAVRDTTFQLTIPLTPTVDDIELPSFHIERLLLLFQSQFMKLVLGVWTGKNIVILTRERTAHDVCQVALALGLIGYFLNPYFFASNVFPYVSINETEFSDVRGYVIGTMNPIFENAKVWGCDLIGDLDTGEVRAGGEDAKKPKENGPSAASVSNTLANAVGIGELGNDSCDLPPHVSVLYTRLITSLQHMQAMRTPLNERCRRLNLIIQEYCHTLVMVGFCEGSSTSVPRSLMNVFFTPAARSLISQIEVSGMTNYVRKHVLRDGEAPELLLCCSALRRCNTGDPFNVLRVLEKLIQLTEQEEVLLLFIRRMPLAVGGLNPLAFQLTHPCFPVRSSALVLLKRVEGNPVGKIAFSSISNFLLLLYEELCSNLKNQEKSTSRHASLVQM